MRKYILIIGIALANAISAQTEETKADYLLNNLDINLVFRSSLEVPEGENNQAGFKLNESRLQFIGKVNPDIKYNLRFRLNRAQEPNTLDNAPASLDFAYVEYLFGKEKQWSIMAGKHFVSTGSWEADINPVFEYQYSDYLNQQLNLFAFGTRLSYAFNANHQLQLEVYNTSNNTFSKLHKTTGYSVNALKAAKLPLGANIIWKGDFWDNRFRTYYSAGVSQVAEGKTNVSLSLGNRFTFGNFDMYLDLHQTNAAVDYANLISPVLNAYNLAQNINYQPVYARHIQHQAAVLRVDYALTPKIFITGKTIAERINSRSESMERHLSHHYINLIGLEFKPFESQNFKIFTHFSNNSYKFHSTYREQTPNTSKNMLSVGLLYLLNIL